MRTLLRGGPRAFQVLTVLWSFFLIPLLIPRRRREMPWPRRTRLALERLGAAWIKLGQVLARVDAAQTQRQISEAEAQVKSAEAAKRRAGASLAGARIELDRGKRLLSEKLMSQQEYDALESRIGVLNAEVDAADAQGGQARARVSLYQQQAKETKLLAPSRMFIAGVIPRFSSAMRLTNGITSASSASGSTLKPRRRVRF